MLQAGEKVGPCNTRYKGMLNNQGYRTQSVSFLELPTEADSAEEGSQVELPTSIQNKTDKSLQMQLMASAG